MRQHNIFKPSLWKYRWYFIMGLPLCGIPILIALWKRNNELLIINGDTITKKSGIINKQEVNTRINNQITVDVRQGVFSRTFDYGDIIIKTPTTVYEFEYMKDPKQIVNLITNQ